MLAYNWSLRKLKPKKEAKNGCYIPWRGGGKGSYIEEVIGMEEDTETF